MRMTTKLLAEIRDRNEAGENDAAIARTLGLKPEMVWRYRKQMGLPSNGTNFMLYTVWDAQTDELLAFGNSKECAAALGLANWATFHQLVSRAKQGKIKKYHIEKVSRREV